MMNQIIEEERTEGRHMWAEPKKEEASALYIDANFEKAFKIDDISSVFHYELITDNGGMDSYMTGEVKDELRCGDFDGTLHEDEIANVYPTLSLSNASEDYFLDVDFAKKVPELDYQFCEELSFGNSSSEIHSPRTSNEVVGLSESSIPMPECFENQSGKSTAYEMYNASGNECGCEIPAEDEMSLKCSLICDLQDCHETNDEVSPVVESEDDMSIDSCAEVKLAIERQRRLCKPPQRYIEGSSWLTSRIHKARKCSSSSSEDEGGRVRPPKKHNSETSKRKASKAMRSNSEYDLDEEYDNLPSSFNIRKSKMRSNRRKNNNLWTLDEVEKLVDGISQFGLGQWTAIKRNFFSSSYRTATDIRDKWRNLVKTNCKSSKRRTEDDQYLRNGSPMLPKPIIERVRELAIAHPIPKRGSKLSRSRRHVTTPSLPE